VFVSFWKVSYQMVSLAGFNAAEVEPMKSFEPIPAGDYKVAITSSEEKPNRKATGSYLSLVMSVLEGEHKNRKLYCILNLDNPNDVAVEIARSDLAAICNAVGIQKPDDSVELHDKPMVVTVSLQKRKDTGGMQNRVGKYVSLKDAAAATIDNAAQPAAAGDVPW